MATVLCWSNKFIFYCSLYSILNPTIPLIGVILFNLEVANQVRCSITDTNYIIACTLTAKR